MSFKRRIVNPLPKTFMRVSTTNHKLQTNLNKTKIFLIAQLTFKRKMKKSSCSLKFNGFLLKLKKISSKQINFKMNIN